MTVWMGDCPRKGISKKRWFKFFETYDIHKWILARETGKNGYEHYQFRFQTSQFDGDEGFKLLKEWFSKAHFEKGSDEWEYERKEGRYFTGNDNPATIQQRYGKLRSEQQRVLALLEETNDREIVLWLDRRGCSGKSWLCGALYERRVGFYVPPFVENIKGIIQFVASGYGGEPIIVIDLPRAIKWTNDLYAGIEAIKDGLVADSRYSARTRNIRGVKVLVLANTAPKLDRLSADRWLVYEPSAPLT